MSATAALVVAALSAGLAQIMMWEDVRPLPGTVLPTNAVVFALPNYGCPDDVHAADVFVDGEPLAVPTEIDAHGDAELATCVARLALGELPAGAVVDVEVGQLGSAFSFTIGDTADAAVPTFPDDEPAALTVVRHEHPPLGEAWFTRRRDRLGERHRIPGAGLVRSRGLLPRARDRRGRQRSDEPMDAVCRHG